MRLLAKLSKEPGWRSCRVQNSQVRMKIRTATAMLCKAFLVSGPPCTQGIQQELSRVWTMLLPSLHKHYTSG